MSGEEVFAKSLVEVPLYQSWRMTGLETVETADRKVRVLYPQTVKRWCVKCDAMLNWSSGGSWMELGSFHQGSHRCPNCNDIFAWWIIVSVEDGVFVATKYGQYPPLERNPPKAMANALGTYYSKLWRSGMTLRNNNYGIGALIYLRRIVEGMTNDLLERLAVAMEASGDPADQVTAVRDLKEARVSFDTKMEQAATMLPKHLRPGGANPVQAIFDVVSVSLHNHSDAECCELVDALAEAMSLLLANLNTHIEEAQALKAAVQKVERLRRG